MSLKPRWTHEKIMHAKTLRSMGFTLAEVHKQLIERFGKTSYSRTWYYVKNTPIEPEFQEVWLNKVHGGGAARRSRHQKELANFYAGHLFRQSNFTQREYLLMCSMLYWGEGAKRDFMLANTDASLMRVFLDSLERSLKIQRHRFTFSLRIFEDLQKNACIQYWCNALGIRQEQIASIVTLEGKKQGKLLYGMCRVRLIKGGQQHKLLSAIKDTVVEMMNAPIAQADRAPDS